MFQKDRLVLVEPNESNQRQVMEYRQEFLDDVSNLDGTGGLGEAQNYSQWLENIRACSQKETCPPGLVTATQYLAVRKEDGCVVGMVNFRHTLNQGLLAHGGHIGYSIRPSQRQKGYAKEALALALEECRQRGLEKVLVTCNKTNLASAKTILANGGLLENELPHGEHITQRYWITL